jgi:transposase
MLISVPLHIPRLTLSEKTRGQLEAMVRRATERQSLVRRAKTILMSADGASAGQIARQLGCTPRTVRTWRSRFRADSRLHSLWDKYRSGRPSKASVATRCKLVQLACERPDENVTAFRDVWTH